MSGGKKLISLDRPQKAMASPNGCMRMVQERGLDARQFEFTRLGSAY